MPLVLDLPDLLTVVIYKETEFATSLATLRRSGGTAKQAADRVDQMLGRLHRGERGPDVLGPLTHHGESRIPHCIKLDLPGYHRLVCVLQADVLSLLYVGTHGDVDRWVEAHRGLTLIVNRKTKRLTPVSVISAQGVLPPRRTPLSHAGDEPLVTSLSEDALSRWPLTPAEYVAIAKLTGSSSDEDLLAAVARFGDATVQDLTLSVLIALREKNPAGAAALIEHYRRHAVTAEEVPRELQEAVASAINSDVLVRLRDLSQYEYELLLRHRSFRDWMIFLHPDQKALVELDFDGPAYLSGVSGSGKTCVLVHRAKRLAEKYDTDRILVLTLNRALAGLLAQLLDDICSPECRGRIDVSAVYDLCKTVVHAFEPSRHLLIYDEHSGETLEDCWTDSFDKPEQAQRLSPVVARLRDRYLTEPQRYVRDEFIWIRSGLRLSDDSVTHSRLESRSAYLDPERVQRTGRAIPLQEDFRTRLLESLAYYEEHLEVGGFVDPASLSLLAHRHLDTLAKREEPFRYRCVLVDEVQDLGAIELEIVRTLSPTAPDGLLLAGDVAQQVYPKRYNLPAAGISVEPRHRRYIRKNYRNTKQILQAGLRLLEAHGEVGNADDGVTALNPELSPRESAKPLAVQCASVAEEFHFASRYIAMHQEQWPDNPICIGVCGVREDDELQLEAVRKRFFEAGIPVRALLEDKAVTPGTVYVAALETVKGFEFSLVVLIHCTQNVLPDSDAPKAEHWRDARRLYVAMTRARDEVLFVYCGKPSPFLNCLDVLAGWSTAREQGLALA